MDQEELITLSHMVRDNIFKKLVDREVRTEEEYNKYVGIVGEEEFSDLGLSGCQESAIMKEIGYDVGHCIRQIIDTYGLFVFRGLDNDKINHLIIRQAIIDDWDLIKEGPSYEMYLIYCGDKEGMSG
jgi:hypothetical protein